MSKHFLNKSSLYSKLNKNYQSVPFLCTKQASTNTSDEIVNKPKLRKQQYVKFSSMAPEANLQSNSNGHSSSYLAKKRTDLSESRERLTNMRFFYADPEIDKACEKPLIRLNPMTMMYMGVSDDNSHLLRSSNYLRNELPIRLAHMIKELRNLPFIVSCNPSLLEIHERCIRAFREFDNFEKEIKDINTEKRFNQLVFNMLDMNKDILALLCDGFKDTRKYIKNESFIKTNINKILSARLGLRLLCEHHLALNKQSNLHNVLLPTSTESNDLLEYKTNNSDNYNSTYLPSNSGDNPNGQINRDEEWVGIIHKKFSPKKLIENSAKLVTRLCVDKYGIAPKIKIDGHINAQFPYLPLPLEYIMPELLKNSFRATAEHHKCTSLLPDVNITIALNEKDFVLRIRDRGGGIPHRLINKIFDYHFTTADEADNNDNNNNNSNETSKRNNSFINIDLNQGIGMICEASSTRGLAVMHGYGFGLPTSKAYAEYLGGSLTFQSMQGIGTDFYLRLSLLDVEPELVRI